MLLASGEVAVGNDAASEGAKEGERPVVMKMVMARRQRVWKGPRGEPDQQ
jgi:hypothetical protein